MIQFQGLRGKTRLLWVFAARCVPLICAQRLYMNVLLKNVACDAENEWIGIERSKEDHLLVIRATTWLWTGARTVSRSQVKAQLYRTGERQTEGQGKMCQWPRGLRRKIYSVCQDQHLYVVSLGWASEEQTVCQSICVCLCVSDWHANVAGAHFMMKTALKMDTTFVLL